MVVEKGLLWKVNRSHSTSKLGRTEQLMVFQTLRLTKILNQNVNVEKSKIVRSNQIKYYCGVIGTN